jgi:hypothetical protein
MFQDELRFGRINIPRSCWAPPGIRPVCGQQIVREYTYAYIGVSPKDGRLDSLILPNMYTPTMSVFLEEISQRYSDEYILMIMDGAPCHISQDLNIPDNIMSPFTERGRKRMPSAIYYFSRAFVRQSFNNFVKFRGNPSETKDEVCVKVI